MSSGLEFKPGVPFPGTGCRAPFRIPRPATSQGRWRWGPPPGPHVLLHCKTEPPCTLELCQETCPDSNCPGTRSSGTYCRPFLHKLWLHNMLCMLMWSSLGHRSRLDNRNELINTPRPLASTLTMQTRHCVPQFIPLRAHLYAARCFSQWCEAL